MVCERFIHDLNVQDTPYLGLFVWKVSKKFDNTLLS